MWFATLGGMRSWLARVHEHLRTSLWFLPLIGLLLALGLAGTTVWFDARLSLPLLTAVITSDAEAARAILSVVATSMLTLTALVFSITIVVLQLASSQHSPRVTRAFLRDRHTKVTLALFLGTFAYSLLVLRSVRTNDGGFIPTLSVGVTYLLVFASLLRFTWYLDHVSRSIRVSDIVRRLAEEAVSLYERVAREGEARPRSGLAPPELPVTRIVTWEGPAGVLIYVDESSLTELAARGDTVVVSRHAVGDFIPHGAEIFEVRGGHETDTNGDKLSDCFAIGEDRTPQQDLGLPIRHLVDLALHALSPGINDPTTAVQALDYVHDLLRRLALITLPPRNVVGPDAKVRLVLPRESWETLVALAVTEIRLAAADQIQVSRRVLHMLDDLLKVAPPERRPTLEHQRRLWLRATESGLGEEDDRRAARRADPRGLGAA